MKRPDFTPEEKKLIDHVRFHETSALRTWSFYIPMVAVATIMFVVGVYQQHIESEVTGFAIVTYFLLRFVAYQAKPGWNLKAIIDKYEAGFKEE